MGVPAFYRWLVSKYPKAVVKVLQEDKESSGCNHNDQNATTHLFDNLYLDLNGLIHPSFHPQEEHDNVVIPTTFEQVFNNVFEYIDRLFNIVKPRKLLYIAIDGVAPRAKMNQQRVRRFKSSRESEIREDEENRLRKLFEMEGRHVIPKEESEVWDSNMITPGTEFMHTLSKALQEYVISRIGNDASWKNIMVILSDSNVPGEGEHKIMSFIRKQRSLPQYDPNTRHCLYGLDADLVMLALATHEPHFSILREDVLMQEGKPKSAANAKPFEFLHIWLLREYLELDLKIQEEDKPKNVCIDFERIVDDFIFIVFFCGNDFLPHMPTLEIYEDAIDLLITVYKKEFKNLGGYIVDMSRVDEKNASFVKLSRVERFIQKVGTYEEKIFQKRSEIREKRMRRLVRELEDAKQEEENSNSISDHENGKSSAFFSDKNLVPTDSEILQNTKDLKEQLNKFVRQKSDIFNSAGFSEITNKVHKYTEGLVWVLKYYYSGVPSWTWFYPYNYGPFASDLKGMSQVRVKFEKGVPFKPFDQLLAVLPPRSAHALPTSYAQLMVDDKSNIIDFYPQDFEIDMEGKRFSTQGICKIPFIDEGRLLSESRKLENKLTEEEAIRNSVGADLLFSGITKLASKFKHQNTKFDITINDDGIAGCVSICNEKVNLDTTEDSVLCVYYELPVVNLHSPRLLCGLELPPKTISENEMMDTQLWHERERHKNFLWGVQNQRKLRNANSEGSSSSNRISSQSCNNFKVAGVGWSRGSGRGKQADQRDVYKKSSNVGVNEEMMSLGIAESNQSSKSRVWGRGRGGVYGSSSSHMNSCKRQDQSQLLQPVREAPSGQDLHQISEIVRAVKRHPAHRVVTHESRRHHQLGEPERVHPVVGVPPEVDPLLPEQRDGVGRVGVTLHVEIPEIELPDESVTRSEVGEVAVGVGEGETELDDVQGVDVGLEEAVVIGGADLAVAARGGLRRTVDDAGKFRVHGDERVGINQIPDEVEFGIEIGGPYLTDHHRFRIRILAEDAHGETNGFICTEIVVFGN
ncbi:5'-3' exoribonuclease 3-like [Senna tora]|uniref:5'-3' exoribonuclease 3-like n=1 Tax=Senna tora TaxID=362788 RepID=A0A834WNB8_9FABA|nr:5'-3' exoribonuclease 3-like [Senna tora]